jgi:hypothetical protein
MRRLLVLLLLTTALHAETYRDEKCGIEFYLPAGWSVGDFGAGNWWKHYLKREQVRCELGIRPPGWERRAAEADGFLHPYAIDILVADASFADVSRIFFSRENGQWFIGSRGGDVQAEDFTNACCQGVWGHSWCRVWNKHNEVGTKAYEAVVLNDRQKHSVLLQVETDEEFERELKRIVNTWRFIR